MSLPFGLSVRSKNSHSITPTDRIKKKRERSNSPMDKQQRAKRVSLGPFSWSLFFPRKRLSKHALNDDLFTPSISPCALRAPTWQFSYRNEEEKRGRTVRHMLRNPHDFLTLACFLLLIRFAHGWHTTGTHSTHACCTH